MKCNFFDVYTEGYKKASDVSQRSLGRDPPRYTVQVLTVTATGLRLLGQSGKFYAASHSTLVISNYLAFAQDFA